MDKKHRCLDLLPYSQEQKTCIEGLYKRRLQRTEKILKVKNIDALRKVKIVFTYPGSSPREKLEQLEDDWVNGRISTEKFEQLQAPLNETISHGKAFKGATSGNRDVMSADYEGLIMTVSIDYLLSEDPFLVPSVDHEIAHLIDNDQLFSEYHMLDHEGINKMSSLLMSGKEISADDYRRFSEEVGKRDRLLAEMYDFLIKSKSESQRTSGHGITWRRTMEKLTGQYPSNDYGRKNYTEEDLP